MKKLIPMLLMGALTLPVQSETPDIMHPDAAKIIDVWLESALDYQDIPYLSASYSKGSEVVWNGAYGEVDRDNGLAANEDTISSICSISKVVTATAIMKLVDEGKLTLDAKLSVLLPELTIEQAYPDSGEITIKHLLNHTSGLPRDTNHSYWSGPNHDFPSVPALYESLATQATMGEADGQHFYSNIGYAVLGLIIAEVSGKSYKDYVESEIFAPIGMSKSVVELPKEQLGITHAIGYTAINRDGNRRQASVYQTKAMQPAAGVSSNAKELAKFATWQFAELQADSKIIMSTSTLEQMYQTGHSEATTHRGLGYQISKDKSGDTWAMHGGICPGYSSFLKINLTDKEAFVVTTSANRVKALNFVNNLNDIVTRGRQLNPTAQTKIDLNDYVGFYDLNPWNSEYYIGKWGRDLVLLYLPVDSIKYGFYQYQAIGKDSFQLVENGELKSEVISFTRNNEGRVISVNNDGNEHAKLEP